MAGAGGAPPDQTILDGIVIWNGSAWVVPQWGVAPLALSGDDNLLVQLANTLVRENVFPGREIRLVLNAVGGSPIIKWTRPFYPDALGYADYDVMWQDLVTQLTDAAVPRIDAMLWYQGEADSTTLQTITPGIVNQSPTLPLHIDWQNPALPQPLGVLVSPGVSNTADSYLLSLLGDGTDDPLADPIFQPLLPRLRALSIGGQPMWQPWTPFFAYEIGHWHDCAALRNDALMQLSMRGDPLLGSISQFGWDRSFSPGDVDHLAATWYVEASERAAISLINAWRSRADRQEFSPRDMGGNAYAAAYDLGQPLTTAVSTTATWTGGQTTMVVADVTGIIPGQYITSGSGLAADTTVSGLSGTTVTFSPASTGAGTAQAVTFNGLPLNDLNFANACYVAPRGDCLFRLPNATRCPGGTFVIDLQAGTTTLQCAQAFDYGGASVQTTIYLTQPGQYTFRAIGARWKQIADPLTLGGQLAGGSFNPTAVATIYLPSVAAGGAGSGYAVGDLVNIVGGTYSVQGQIKVTAVGGGGSVTTLNVNNAGAYAVHPQTFTAGAANAVATSAATGVGTGLTLKIPHLSPDFTSGGFIGNAFEVTSDIMLPYGNLIQRGRCRIINNGSANITAAVSSGQFLPGNGFATGSIVIPPLAWYDFEHDQSARLRAVAGNSGTARVMGLNLKRLSSTGDYVSTTDATVTTIGALTPPVNFNGLVTVTIWAHNGNDKASGVIAARVARDSTGSSRLIGSNTALVPFAGEGTVATATAAVDISGSTVRARATGVAVTNIDWAASFDYQYWNI